MGFISSIFGSSDKATLNDVISVIENIKIKAASCATEKNVENIILKHLREEFEDVHAQYSVGGYLGLKIDIDINDGDFGVEIKLATALNSATAIQRLIGQAVYYKVRKYKEDLVVVIVGNKNYKDEPMMKELIYILEDLDVSVVYLSCIK